MKIGILGGTFSPIHDGHLRLARTYARELELDRVLFIPTAVPPHKEAPGLPDGEHRCRMTELALSGHPGFELSEIEQQRPGRSYTVDTLTQLHGLYPGAELYFLAGSDMFRTVLDWHRGEEIVRLATVCTMERGEDTAAQLEDQASRIIAAGGSARVIHAPPMDISSTGIRRRLAEGCRDAAALGIAPAVLDYIWQNGLYGTSPEDYPWPVERYIARARELEKPERFEHSMNVARRAAELAERYGSSRRLCYIAGVLHDICKNLPQEQQFSLLKRLRGGLKSVIINDKSLAEVPPIWHGPAAAAYLYDELGVYSREILAAVAYHTTGRAGMTLFEKIIYVSDLTSAERDYPDAVQLRELADRDLDAAIRESLLFTLKKMKKHATPLTGDTVRVMEEYGVLTDRKEEIR